MSIRTASNTSDIDNEPGRSLMQARSEAGMSVDEAAEKLHLTTHQVNALDHNRYAELPEKPYVKGYLRNYARLLDLNPDPILNAYTKSHATVEPVVIKQKKVKMQITSNDQVVKFTTFAVAAVIVGLVIVWWQNQADDAVIETAVAPQTPDVPKIEGWFPDLKDSIDELDNSDVSSALNFAASENRTPNTEANDGEIFITDEQSNELDAVSSERVDQGKQVDLLVNAKTSTVEDILSSEERQTLSQQAVARVETSVTAATTAVEQVSQIVLYVHEDSWADIRDAKDSKLIYETVAAGRVVNLEGVAPFSIFIGNADGVWLFYENKKYDITQHKRGQVARFVLGSDS